MITERQRTDALKLCDDIQLSIAKVKADFDAMEKAAADFRRDVAEWKRLHGLATE